MKTLLLGLLLGVLFASNLTAQAQDERRQRAMDRAEKRFTNAMRKKEEAEAVLVSEYQAAEAWVAQSSSDEPPAVLQAYFAYIRLPETDVEAERTRLSNHPFHEIWNERLYKRSKAVKSYTGATAEAEKAFLALERLRHPERFERGYDKTPAGMILVPAASYRLGPATGNILEQPKIQKERTLKLRSFYLDRREVNCAEYANFLLAEPISLREEDLPLGWTMTPERAPLFPDGWANVPVTGISWDSARRYAEWAGKRLPTEDEWEAAAAGPQKRRYPLGNQFSARKVNCRENGAGGPRPPQEFGEDITPLGALCMSGNVREWTASGFHGKAVKKTGDLVEASVRGGSFLDNPAACSSTYRWLVPVTERRPNIGFRCAKDVR